MQREQEVPTMNNFPFSQEGAPSSSTGDEPTDVTTAQQLRFVPAEFLSGDEARPLRYPGRADEGSGAASMSGHRSATYALRPTTHSVLFILLMEALERFTYYGIRFTMTAYLTGAYGGDWNAGLDAVSASTWVSACGAVAYTAPFLGAAVADSLLGDYATILLGTALLYIPGLVLIACTTVPHLLGGRFNRGALAAGLTALEPAGAGTIKSVVNVFGAKQYHPVLQSSLVDSYYVIFYICINVGALTGGLLIPVVAQRNITVAYFIPVLALTTGIIIFALGRSRYIHSQQRAELMCYKKIWHDDTIPITTNSKTGVLAVAKLTALVVPFAVAYSQIVTTFVVQGTVMEQAIGWIDASIMINCDGISVIICGYAVGIWLYPALSRRGIVLGSSQRFAVGSFLGALAIGWALVVEQKIHNAYGDTRGAISVTWQAPSYALIGAGEIFTFSTAYKAAFEISPPEHKALASAVNLFFIGAVPNFLSIGLYQLCHPWFWNDHGNANITQLEDYVQAKVGRYFAVLLVIALMGTCVNLLPAVRLWMVQVEKQAADMSRKPDLEMTTESSSQGRLKSPSEESLLLHLNDTS